MVWIRTLLLFLLVSPGVASAAPADDDVSFASMLLDNGFPALAAQVCQRYLDDHFLSENARNAMFLWARALQQKGEPDSAADLYVRYAQISPGDDRTGAALLEASSLYQQAGHDEKALAALRSAASLGDDGERTMGVILQAARHALLLGHYQVADSLLSNLISHHPKGIQAAEARYFLVHALWELGEEKRAEEVLEELLGGRDRNEWKAKALLILGDRAAAKGDSTGSRKRYQQVVGDYSEYPAAAEAGYKLGMLLKRDNPSEALSAFGMVASVFSESPWGERALWQRAEILREEGDCVSSVATVQGLLERAPAESLAVHARLSLARSLRCAGQPAEARGIYDGIITGGYDPEVVRVALRERGELERSLGMTEQALSTIRDYLKLYPGAPDAEDVKLLKARIELDDLGEWETGLAGLRSLASLATDGRIRRVALYEIGRCYEHGQNWTKAVEAYRTYCTQYPRGRLSDVARERIEYLEGYRPLQLERAVGELVTRFGSQPSAFQQARFLEEDLKDYERAIQYYLRSLAQDPSDHADEAEYRIGRCYLRLSRRAELLRQGDAASYRSQAQNAFRRIAFQPEQGVWGARAAQELIVLDTKGLSNREACLSRLALADSFVAVYAEAPFSAWGWLVRGESAECLEEWEHAARSFEMVLSVQADDSIRAQALWRLGNIYLVRGDTTAALERFRTAAQQVSGTVGSARAQFDRAQVLMAGGELKEAARLLDQVTRGLPQEEVGERAMYQHALVLSELGHYQESLDHYRSFIERYPESGLVAEARYGIGFCLSRLNQEEAALRQWDQLIVQDLPPEVRDDLHRERIRTLLALDQDSLALPALERLHRESTAQDVVTWALCRLGDLHLRAGRAEDALSSYQEAADQDSESPEALLGVIAALFQLGHGERAERQVARFLKDYPDDMDGKAKILVLRARFHMDGDDLERAEQNLLKVIEEYPGQQWRPDALYWHGVLRLKQGHPAEARASLEELLLGWPDHRLVPGGRFKLATTHYAMEDYAKAAQLYRQVAEESDSLAIDARFNEAICQKKLGHHDEAAAIYRMLLSTMPDSPLMNRIWLDLGHVERERGRLAQAVAAYGAVRPPVSAEDDADLNLSLGDCYFELGQLQHALVAYLRVAFVHQDLDLWAVTARYKAGLVLEALGKNDQARSLYRGIIASRGHDDDWSRMAQDRVAELDREVPQP
jgi:tetratricopeptide (TPR) repeat protein